MRITGETRSPDGKVLFKPIVYSHEHVERHMSGLRDILASGAQEVIIVRRGADSIVHHHYERVREEDQS